MTAQAGLWTGAGAAALVALAASIAEWRRVKRRNLDEVGWMPWQGLQVAGVMVAVVLGALAFHA